MRILVTNDDGIMSEGIAELAGVAVHTGMEVVIAAPSAERSGTAAALLSVESDAGVMTDVVDIDTAPHTKAYSVHASPALIAMLASRGTFGAPPDLVLSGINHGPNTGSAVLHSGTVGAAFTAVAHGVPAIAFSFAPATPDSWATAVTVAEHVVRWATAQHARRGLQTLVLNVNIPDVPPERLQGLRSARLATFGAAQARVATPGHTETVTVSETDGHPDPESDAALLAAGWATVTAIRAPCEVPTHLSGLVGAAMTQFQTSGHG